MQLPKHICEDCHKLGRVTEAVFRIERKEITFHSFLDTREWELCEKHFLNKSLIQFLNNWDFPNASCTFVKWDFKSLKVKRLTWD